MGFLPPVFPAATSICDVNEVLAALGGPGRTGTRSSAAIREMECTRVFRMKPALASSCTLSQRNDLITSLEDSLENIPRRIQKNYQEYRKNKQSLGYPFVLLCLILLTINNIWLYQKPG